jgi:hypothetical protein
VTRGNVDAAMEEDLGHGEAPHVRPAATSPARQWSAASAAG